MGLGTNAEFIYRNNDEDELLFPTVVVLLLFIMALLLNDELVLFDAVVPLALFPIALLLVVVVVVVALLVLLESLSLFRKKEMATPKLSVRFIKNLFFLRIGALPTATRCTLTFGLMGFVIADIVVVVVEGVSFLLLGDDDVSTDVIIILNFTLVFYNWNWK